ncbi:hypothetical protein BFX80_17180 [Cobetia marina]|nr:hypothetical protein BFX80_17180 [Cobetia marina]
MSREKLSTAVSRHFTADSCHAARQLAFLTAIEPATEHVCRAKKILVEKGEEKLRLMLTEGKTCERGGRRLVHRVPLFRGIAPASRAVLPDQRMTDSRQESTGG